LVALFFLPAKIRRADASWMASTVVIAGSAAVVVIWGWVAEVTGSEVEVIAGIGGIVNFVKKLSAPGSVEERHLLFLLLMRTKSISVFSLENWEVVETVVVSKEVSAGCGVARLVAISSSGPGTDWEKGKIVASSKASSVTRVASSPIFPEIVSFVKFAEFSTVSSVAKFSTDISRAVVSGLREEGDFPCEFDVAYVLKFGEGRQ
jgi:hypothetical protein